MFAAVLWLACLSGRYLIGIAVGCTWLPRVLLDVNGVASRGPSWFVGGGMPWWSLSLGCCGIGLVLLSAIPVAAFERGGGHLRGQTLIALGGVTRVAIRYAPVVWPSIGAVMIAPLTFGVGGFVVALVGGVVLQYTPWRNVFLRVSPPLLFSLVLEVYYYGGMYQAPNTVEAVGVSALLASVMGAVVVLGVQVRLFLRSRLLARVAVGGRLARIESSEESSVTVLWGGAWALLFALATSGITVWLTFGLFAVLTFALLCMRAAPHKGVAALALVAFMLVSLIVHTTVLGFPARDILAGFSNQFGIGYLAWAAVVLFMHRTSSSAGEFGFQDDWVSRRLVPAVAWILFGAGAAACGASTRGIVPLVLLPVASLVVCMSPNCRNVPLQLAWAYLPPFVAGGVVQATMATTSSPVGVFLVAYFALSASLRALYYVGGMFRAVSLAEVRVTPRRHIADFASLGIVGGLFAGVTPLSNGVAVSFFALLVATLVFLVERQRALLVLALSCWSIVIGLWVRQTANATVLDGSTAAGYCLIATGAMLVSWSLLGGLRCDVGICAVRDVTDVVILPTADDVLPSWFTAVVRSTLSSGRVRTLRRAISIEPEVMGWVHFLFGGFLALYVPYIAGVAGARWYLWTLQLALAAAVLLLGGIRRGSSHRRMSGMASVCAAVFAATPATRDITQALVLLLGSVVVLGTVAVYVRGWMEARAATARVPRRFGPGVRSARRSDNTEDGNPVFRAAEGAVQGLHAVDEIEAKRVARESQAPCEADLPVTEEVLMSLSDAALLRLWSFAGTEIRRRGLVTPAATESAAVVASADGVRRLRSPGGELVAEIVGPSPQQPVRVLRLGREHQAVPDTK